MPTVEHCSFINSQVGPNLRDLTVILDRSRLFVVKIGKHYA